MVNMEISRLGIRRKKNRENLHLVLLLDDVLEDVAFLLVSRLRFLHLPDEDFHLRVRNLESGAELELRPVHQRRAVEDGALGVRLEFGNLSFVGKFRCYGYFFVR